MIMVDEQGRIVLANAQTESLFGYTRHELIGEPVERLVPVRFRGHHPHDRAAFFHEPRSRAMGTGRDLHAVRKDGVEVPVEIGLNPILTEEGGFVLAAIVDITERKRSEEERNRLLRRLAFLGDIIRSVTSSLHLDTVLQRIVDGAKELCGSDVAVLLAREDASDVLAPRYVAGQVHKPDLDPLRVQLGRGAGGQVLLTRRPFRTADYTHDPRVPADFYPLATKRGLVALMVVPILIGDRVEGLLNVENLSPRAFTDEDEEICVRLADFAAIAIQNAQLFAREQTARAEAEAANRAKDQFLAVLSHELRTPLNVMMGWVRILRGDQLQERQRTHALEVIERNTRLQAQLINDLLDVSRIIAGKLELDRFPLDLVPVVQDAVDAIRAEAQAKALTLDVELDPTAGEVLGDQLRLQQVVTNLLSNALKFTPTGGCIGVRLQREGPHVCLSVSDTGEGIDPAVLPHIFKPFHQADSTTTRAHQGLGLGLAIVRQIVERHGGAVEAQSRGRDRGTVFIVRLPITALRALPGVPNVRHREFATSGLPDERRALEGRRVLVVDDQADARDLLALVLRQQGAEVQLAASADEAVQLLSRAPIDVLVSDLAMPGTDGYDLIRTVRTAERQRGGPRIRAIALTAYAGAESRERALAAGFELHATKPLSPETLVDLITKLT
jgi:PAS domain S-box-containing protein